VAVAEYCWSVLGRCGFTRSDVVVGIGGGAVTDLAGFVAATCWLRGVRLVLVPTTLLGMVDAAVGGKTAVNTPRARTWSARSTRRPACCATWPPWSPCRRRRVRRRAGRGRQGRLHRRPDDPRPHRGRPGRAARRTARDPRAGRAGVRVKAAVVAADLRETGTSGVSREILNYGHTLGHAIERVERYRWRHGAAVSVGLVFAAELGGSPAGSTTPPPPATGRCWPRWGCPRRTGPRRGRAATRRCGWTRRRGGPAAVHRAGRAGPPSRPRRPRPAALAAAFAEIADGRRGGR
jgi:3-dehydroquinate synthase